MAAARRQPAMQIFQDPVAPGHHHDVSAYEAQVLDAYGSVTDVSPDLHTLLSPPQIELQPQSPQKARHPSSSPPPRVLAEKGLNHVSLPRPQEQRFSTDAPTKRVQRPVTKPQAMKGPPLFNSWVSQFDKENIVADTLPAVQQSGHPIKPVPLPKAGTKRSLSDAAPLRGQSTKTKQKPTREPPRPAQDDGPLPEPDEMPPVEDDSQPNIKPPYSYAILIGMAILRAPNRRLTLAQIYKWISDTFAFYRSSEEMGWQNSIRHNLSLSKSFSKQERPKDDPGKGHYWRINPGFEHQYYKIKPARRTTNPDGFVPTHASDLARPTSSASASVSFPLSVVKSIDSSKFPEETELSSDATIPNSDPAAHDGIAPSRTRPSRQMPSSPPPADIHSSPPPVARSVREGTPPRPARVERFSHSRSGGRNERKRKFDAGDSGFYSSIESSAIKGGPLATLLTSEADHERPHMKRGRAEEEIARIRGSSYDSPSKTRPYMQQPSTSGFVSSPFRTIGETGDGPLTPAIIFKRPALPPASASPNTNLRNHRNRMRELLGGSPDKNMPTLVNSTFLDTMWSPAVKVPNDENVNLMGQGFESTFDIFRDYDYQNSPLKSAKRPRLERAATTTGILAGITGNTASPTPNWRSAFLEIPNLSPIRQRSPMKPPTSYAPVTFYPQVETDTKNKTSASTPRPDDTTDADDDIFHLLHSDDSEPGIDLLQGFEKIGARASVAPNGSPTKAPPRSTLARSASTRF